MQSPQSLNQIQLQQQLMGVAQQNLASPSASDLECRRLRMLLNNRNVGLVMDGRLDFIGDMVPNIGSSVQIGCPVLPCTDTELLLKVSFCFCTLKLVNLIIFSPLQKIYGL